MNLRWHKVVHVSRGCSWRWCGKLFSWAWLYSNSDGTMRIGTLYRINSKESLEHRSFSCRVSRAASEIFLPCRYVIVTEFNEIKALTYNTYGDESGLDTFDFRWAIWNYVLRIKGVVNDEYMYRAVCSESVLHAACEICVVTTSASLGRLLFYFRRCDIVPLCMSSNDDIWLTVFAKSTQSTMRFTWPKYTLCKFPHSFEASNGEE